VLPPIEHLIAKQKDAGYEGSPAFGGENQIVLCINWLI